MTTIVFDMFKKQFTEFNKILTIESEVPSQILSFLKIISNHFFTDSNHLLDHTISVTF